MIARMKLLIAFVAMVLSFATVAKAQDASVVPDAANQGIIKEMITSQLEAFKRDDANGAYMHAAPMIQQSFPQVEQFMEMVKRGYQPVYRPRSYDFVELKETKLGLTQTVRIIDSMGEAYNALYRVEKQPDGSWKISGVWLFKLPQVGA
jgi:hypothetical protein